VIHGIRNQIDSIDDELVKLLSRRIDLVDEVARYKKDHQLGVKDTDREMDIKRRLLGRIEKVDQQEDILALMEAIFDLSRKRQRGRLNEEAVIGFQGTQGSFSEEMAIHYFGETMEKKSYETFEEVFHALANKEITYGVLPIENSSTGAVKEIYDLLNRYSFYIVGEHYLKVNQHLIGLESAKVDTIREVYSHPQGIEQCEHFLSYYPGWKKVSYLNTATSVALVRDTGDPAIAAIGSERAANIFGLQILKDNINDNKLNTTRFIVIKGEMEEDASFDKISLMFTTAHTAGSLYNILAVLAKNEINMMKIESRPLKHQPGQYFCFVDIEGKLGSENVTRALRDINEHKRYFRVLGHYKKKEGFSS